MNRAQLDHALRWPLWSWRNLTITGVGALALLAGLGQLTQDNTANAAPEPSITVTPASSTATPSSTEPSTTTSTPGRPVASTDANRASAVSVAQQFVAAWASGGDDQAWLDAMRGYATTELIRSFDGTDPAQVPATRATGDGALRKSTANSASVSVPTDGGRVLVTLTRTKTGWLASGLEPEDQAPGAPAPVLTPTGTPTSSPTR